MANLTSVQSSEKTPKISSSSCGTTPERLKYEQAVARVLFEYYLHGVNEIRSTLIVLDHSAKVQVNLVLDDVLAAAKSDGELGLNDVQKAIFAHQSRFFHDEVFKLRERSYGARRLTQDQIKTWNEAMTFVYLKADSSEVSTFSVSRDISAILGWNQKQQEFATLVLEIVELLAIVMHRKQRDSLLEALLFIVTFTLLDRAWFEHENVVEGLAYLNYISPAQWHFVSRELDLFITTKDTYAEDNRWSTQDTAGFQSFYGLQRQWKDLLVPSQTLGRVHDSPVDENDRDTYSGDNSAANELELDQKKRKFETAQQEYVEALAKELTVPGTCQNNSKKRKTVLNDGIKYLHALETQQDELEKKLPGVEAQMYDPQIGETGFFQKAIWSLKYLLLDNKATQGEVASEMDLL